MPAAAVVSTHHATGGLHVRSIDLSTTHRSAAIIQFSDGAPRGRRSAIHEKTRRLGEPATVGGRLVRKQPPLARVGNHTSSPASFSLALAGDYGSAGVVVLKRLHRTFSVDSSSLTFTVVTERPKRRDRSSVLDRPGDERRTRPSRVQSRRRRRTWLKSHGYPDAVLRRGLGRRRRFVTAILRAGGRQHEHAPQTADKATMIADSAAAFPPIGFCLPEPADGHSRREVSLDNGLRYDAGAQMVGSISPPAWLHLAGQWRNGQALRLLRSRR